MPRFRVPFQATVEFDVEANTLAGAVRQARRIAQTSSGEAIYFDYPNMSEAAVYIELDSPIESDEVQEL